MDRYIIQCVPKALSEFPLHHMAFTIANNLVSSRMEYQNANICLPCLSVFRLLFFLKQTFSFISLHILNPYLRMIRNCVHITEAEDEIPNKNWQ